MPDAKFTLSLDATDARAELSRFRTDVQETARDVERAAPRLTGEVADFAKTLGRQLGVRPSDPVVMDILRKQGLVPSATAPAIVPPSPIIPGLPAGEAASPELWHRHAGGLQQMAHSARAVADTMLYRVNPALGEAHRAIAGMLLVSGSAMGLLAGTALSAATVIGVQLFGSLLRAKNEAHDFAVAVEVLRGSVSLEHPDLSGFERIAKEHRNVPAKLRVAAREVELLAVG